MGDREEYRGIEQGPVRPPNESFSLLLRVTRNCPWNRCTFCRAYKGEPFSFRRVEDIIRDIDLIHTYVKEISQVARPGAPVSQDIINPLYKNFQIKDRLAFNTAVNWHAAGLTSVFLQDADSLVMPLDALVAVLSHLRDRFPQIRRVTSYARSQTILRLKLSELERIRKAGLTRIHNGMESGSDNVLVRIKKGVDKAGHITAGLKAKAAGLSLSEYIMPGIGGMDGSIDHALETAAALNVINPDFIRFRTLAVVPGTPLADQAEDGLFEKLGDIMIAREIRLLLEALDGITSTVKSDHILNLFETIEGRFPEDKARMIGVIDRFFELSCEEQVLYQIGRRMGLFNGLEDMVNSPYLSQVREACLGYGVTPSNVDDIINELMKRFV